MEDYMKNDAYKKGLESGLHDWCLTGDHRTSECPYDSERQSSDWYLGRVHGFMQADEIIHPKKD